MMSSVHTMCSQDGEERMPLKSPTRGNPEEALPGGKKTV